MEIAQVIERGLHAANILHDEMTMSFFEELKALIRENIVNTNPEASADRERLYYQYHAIEDVVGVMNSYVMAREKAIQQMDAEEHDDTQDDD